MSKYTCGENAVQPYARFETKKGDGSGAGYERWRSTEHRPHTAVGGREDVYVAHHRLLALLLPEFVDEPIGVALKALDGCDVHHPNGIKWDNRLERREADGEPNLEIVSHDRHSTVTQAQVRAWAEDTKREQERRERGISADDVCARCGEPADTLATSPGYDGRRCLDCAMDSTDGEPIEL